MEAVLSGDRERFRQAFSGLGMVRAGESFDFDWAFELLVSRLLRCLVEDRPLRFEVDAVRRDIEMFFLDHPEAQKVVLPPRCLYGFRIYWGMFAVLTALQAEANWRRVALEVLREAGSAACRDAWGASRFVRSPASTSCAARGSFSSGCGHLR